MRRLMWLAGLLTSCFDFGVRPAALFLVSDEPPGVNCEFGGLSVQSGIDLNQDGVLEETEIDTQVFVCEDKPVEGFGSVLEGNFTIENEVDLAAMAGVVEVTGDLTIRATGFAALALPDLQSVGGRFTVNGNGSMSLDFPALVEARGALSIDVDSLRSISAPLLVSVGEELLLGTNGSQLLAVDLSSLETVGKDMVLLGALDLASLSLPNLRSVGFTLLLIEMTKLRVLDMPVLETVVGFTIRDNTRLPTCHVQSILNGLTAPPATVDIIGNDDTATCP